MSNGENKTSGAYTGVRDAFHADPKLVHEHYARSFERSNESFYRATDALIKYLLFANAGGLLIAFTFSGVLVQTGESMLRILLPAAFFFVGLFQTGMALFELRKGRMLVRDYDVDKYFAVILGTQLEMSDAVKEKTRRAFRAYQNYQASSFILFLIGAFFGFLVLAIS